jgi:hypothetical protein
MNYYQFFAAIEKPPKECIGRTEIIRQACAVEHSCMGKCPACGGMISKQRHELLKCGEPLEEGSVEE